jgi:hypothetical protein
MLLMVVGTLVGNGSISRQKLENVRIQLTASQGIMSIAHDEVRSRVAGE